MRIFALALAFSACAGALRRAWRDELDDKIVRESVLLPLDGKTSWGQSSHRRIAAPAQTLASTLLAVRSGRIPMNTRSPTIRAGIQRAAATRLFFNTARSKEQAPLPPSGFEWSTIPEIGFKSFESEATKKRPIKARPAAREAAVQDVLSESEAEKKKSYAETVERTASALTQEAQEKTKRKQGFFRRKLSSVLSGDAEEDARGKSQWWRIAHWFELRNRLRSAITKTREAQIEAHIEESERISDEDVNTYSADEWPDELYPYHPNMHNVGNDDQFHPDFAYVFTKLADAQVYGRDLRQEIIDSQGVNKSILDLGCGIGFSTSSSPGSLGIDTSDGMIRKAQQLFPNKNFMVAHAEYWVPNASFDVITSMFIMHEIPRESRKRIIDRATSNAKEKVVIVDVTPDYEPNQAMVAGEPYIMEYLKNIKDDLSDFTMTELVKGHVAMWELSKKVIQKEEEVGQHFVEKAGKVGEVVKNVADTFGQIAAGSSRTPKIQMGMAGTASNKRALSLFFRQMIKTSRDIIIPAPHWIPVYGY